LATVYGIVKQHKGFIDVESAPGQGTTFQVFLPSGEGLPDAQEKPQEDALRGGNESILIAEDNEGLREAAKEILESLGYRVLLAKDGADAVRVFEENHASIDLVFMDVVMPYLNGPNAYTQMCAVRPDLPVIFTTGYASEATLLSVRSMENSAVLQKPYGSQYFAKKLREVLDKKPS